MDAGPERASCEPRGFRRPGAAQHDVNATSHQGGEKDVRTLRSPAGHDRDHGRRRVKRSEALEVAMDAILVIMGAKVSIPQTDDELGEALSELDGLLDQERNNEE